MISPSALLDGSLVIKAVMGVRLLKSLIKSVALSAGYTLGRANLRTMPFWRLVAELQRRGISNVIDIGSNDGEYAGSLIEAGYRGDIISFEPLPAAHAALSERAKRRSGWRVAPPFALGDADGTATFHEAGNSVSSSLLQMAQDHIDAAPESRTVRSIEVEVRRLDGVYRDLGLDKNSFMKIDTQGTEREVLVGARDYIARWVQGIQVEHSLYELYRGQALWREVDRDIAAMGFEMWDLLPGFRHHETGRLMQFDAVYLRKAVDR